LEIGELPAADVDAFGFGFARVEGVVEEAVDEGGFADAALADEDHFNLVEGVTLPGEKVQVGADDGLGIFDLGQDFRWNPPQVTTAQVERLQLGQSSNLRGECCQLIAAEGERLQLSQLSDPWGERCQMIAAKGEHLQLDQLSDLRRKRRQFVPVEGKRLQLGQLLDLRRERR